jgi:hypothetical protein
MTDIRTEGVSSMNKISRTLVISLIAWVWLAGGTSSAATPGWSLPLSQAAINGNPGPLSPGSCHHGACNNKAQSYWAIDLFGANNSAEFAVQGGYVQVSGYSASCGNRREQYPRRCLCRSMGQYGSTNHDHGSDWLWIRRVDSPAS